MGLYIYISAVIASLAGFILGYDIGYVYISVFSSSCYVYMIRKKGETLIVMVDCLPTKIVAYF